MSGNFYYIHKTRANMSRIKDGHSNIKDDIQMKIKLRSSSFFSKVIIMQHK